MKVPVKMTLKNCAELQNWKKCHIFQISVRNLERSSKEKACQWKKSKISPLTLISTGLFRQVCVFSLKLSEKNGNSNLKLGQILVTTVFLKSWKLRLRHAFFSRWYETSINNNVDIIVYHNQNTFTEFNNIWPKNVFWNIKKVKRYYSISRTRTHELWNYTDVIISIGRTLQYDRSAARCQR